MIYINEINDKKHFSLNFIRKMAAWHCSAAFEFNERCEAAGKKPEGWTGYFDTGTAPGAHQWGLMLGNIVLFQR